MKRHFETYPEGERLDYNKESNVWQNSKEVYKDDDGWPEDHHRSGRPLQGTMYENGKPSQEYWQGEEIDSTWQKHDEEWRKNHGVSIEDEPSWKAGSADKVEQTLKEMSKSRNVEGMER